MKKLFFLLVICLSSCNPFDLNEKANIIGGPVEDTAEGQPHFIPLPDIRDLDKIEQERQEGKKDCKDYENSTHVTVLNKLSWARPIANCVLYNIDKGLAPLCAEEKKARKLLDKAKDDEDIETLEEYLIAVEEDKEYIMEEIYNISDTIYDACSSIEEDLEHETDSWDRANDKTMVRVVKGLGKVALDVTVNSECRSIYRTLDSRARMACRGLNLRELLDRE